VTVFATFSGVFGAVASMIQVAVIWSLFVLPVFVIVPIVLSVLGIVAFTLLLIAAGPVILVGMPFAAAAGAIALTKLVLPMVLITASAAQVSSWLRSSDNIEKVDDDSTEEALDVSDLEDEPFGDVDSESLFEFDQQLASRTRTIPRTTYPTQLADWTVEDCVLSLTSAGLVSAARVFSADRIDGAVISMMTEQEVEDEICRGFRLVERKRVLLWLRQNR
jgi:hypothetical protein